MFFYGLGGTFEAPYRAQPFSFMERPQAEAGDKVILPQSALDRLAHLQVDYPMLFKIENRQQGRETHCGVLEFTAPEGVVYMPYWMMQNLILEVGSIVHFKNVSLPKGKYVKLQPHTTDFLDISNPKAVLEKTLRGYSCMTNGDTIVVDYNNKKYYIDVVETRPGDAMSVIETDCEVDFAPPKDYDESKHMVKPPQPKATTEEKQKEAEEMEVDEQQFIAFQGTGRTLKGKLVQGQSTPPPKPTGQSSSAAGSPAQGSSSKVQGGAKPGTVVGEAVPSNRLARKLVNQSSQGAQGAQAASQYGQQKGQEEAKDSKEDSFKAFSGKGYSLK